MKGFDKFDSVVLKILGHMTAYREHHSIAFSVGKRDVGGNKIALSLNIQYLSILYWGFPWEVQISERLGAYQVIMKRPSEPTMEASRRLHG